MISKNYRYTLNQRNIPIYFSEYENILMYLVFLNVEN